jgi:hypothetical protein
MHPVTATIKKQLAVLRQSPDIARERLEQMRKADPQYYEKYVHEQRYGRPAPDTDAPDAPLSYADMRQTVEVDKAVHTCSTDDAWVALAQKHGNRHPEWYAGQRFYQLHERPEALAKAERDADLSTPLPTAERPTRVAKMGTTRGLPWADYVQWKG